MFTSSLPQHQETKLIKNYEGVDLEIYQCHELQNDGIYSNYKKNQLHYVVDAVQKGQKPPTQIGLRRLVRKNAKKALIKKFDKKQIPELNPKGPKEICMKALRTVFLQNLEKNHMQAELGRKERSEKILKRKEHQRQRRNELIRLVKKYRKELSNHFSERLIGYGRCPKISRQEIKDYLKTLGIEAKLDPVEVKQPEESIDERRGKRGFSQKMPMPLMGLSPFGMMGRPLLGITPPLLGMNSLPIGMPIPPHPIYQPPMGLNSFGIPPMTANIPLMGQPPIFGGLVLQPGMILPQDKQIQKNRLENLIKQKGKFLFEENTGKRIMRPLLVYVIEQAGVPTTEAKTMAQNILKENLTLIFNLLENPEEIKKRPEFFNLVSQNLINQAAQNNPSQIVQPVVGQNKPNDLKDEEFLSLQG